MTNLKISPDAPLETVWKGAGWFNVYFLAKFALAHFGYLNLEPAYNALLFAAVVFLRASSSSHEIVKIPSRS